MNWLKTVSDGKGGFDSYEWSINDSLNKGVFVLLTMLAAGVVFSLFIPIIFVFLYPLNCRNQQTSGILLTFIGTAYMLFDYITGFMFWTAFTEAGIPEVHTWFVSMSVILSLFNIAFIYELKGQFKVDKPIIIWGFAAMAVYGLSPIFGSVIEHLRADHIIWFMEEGYPHLSR